MKALIILLKTFDFRLRPFILSKKVIDSIGRICFLRNILVSPNKKYIFAADWVLL